MSTYKEAAKPKGWFSRRHQTGAAHNDAVEAYLTDHGLSARVAKADDRQRETEGRTPSDRLAALDARLGVGVGAKRERARLEAAL